MSGRTIAVSEQLNRESSPHRTCIGCRKQGLRSELIRLVASRSDPVTVVVDERRRLAGRGAWLHPSEPCLALAVKRRAFGRALNGAHLIADVERRILAATATADTPVPAEPTVQPESGSEI
ncbi:YlxR family protein [Pseudarthrobacter sp. J75]|uniref:YlxR family protein n=1 Tax=unclassified Pseudarthrobacter TaxID=2647000 RepID=UPI002E7FEC4E|nr:MULTISPECIES: YlxR family protein [unclassified Pseudarthrobacter]MEE2521801.1 YlxR family protein [Pseudarthrobacter sp. J47]MEE2527878.1 YlxR family protein [Pseudarthrobacter sp. J75]MEE2569449.1 YlxR family protein [Pseudarthrobacter sp. J64]